MRRYDDRLGQAFFESDHAQQVFAVALRIRIGPSAGDPGAFLAQCDSFQLPNEVANKRVARSDGQRHKDDHAAGSVTRRRYNDDRTVTVDVMARRKSEVRAALESVLLIADAAEGFAELALSTRANELVLLRRDPLRQTGKSGKPLTWSQGEWVSRMARSDFWS